ncbi:MAG: alpha/beta family hydrolase, partial [Nocardioides sp.]
MRVEHEVETPHGPGRLLTDRARKPVATLLLSHGAGNGVDTRDLEALAATLPRHGVTVVRFEQPWRVAGRKIATPPATLDTALVAGTDRLRIRTPLIVG